MLTRPRIALRRGAPAVLLVAAMLLPAPGAAQAPADSPQARITSPSRDRAAAGPTRIVVQAIAASGHRIASCRISVDGEVLTVLTSAPWEATFDAGESLASHTVRVEVVDDAGRTGADIITTLHIPYVESVDVHASDTRRGLGVSVLSSTGQPVARLQPSEFHLAVGGKDLPLVDAAPDRRPLAAEVLLDVSGSTRPFLVQIREGANRFLSALGEADRAEVRLFGANVTTLCPFGGDHVAARERILSRPFLDALAKTGGGTHVYDALAGGLETINVRPGQRSIVLFTDTFDVNSTLDFEQVRDVVRRSAIRIDLIRFGHPMPGLDWSLSKQMIRRMETLAEESGGRAWSIRDVDDIAPTFDLLARQLKNRYRLVFVPAGAGKAGVFRPLRVRVDRSGVDVLAPAGFYGE